MFFNVINNYKRGVRTLKARLFKKAICFAVSLMLVMAMMPAVFADGPAAGVDGATVTISGTVVDEGGSPLAGKEVTVLVLKPGETIDSIDMDNPINSISYIDQVTSDENGQYEFVYSLGDAPEQGEYTVFVGGEDIDEPAVVQFVYGSAGEGPEFTLNVEDVALGKIVEVALDADTLADYSVTVNGTELFYSPSRELFIGLFDASAEIDESKVSVDGTAVDSELYIIYGDANNDGGVTVGDATDIVQIVLGNIQATNKEKIMADVTGDGNITVGDATDIVQKVLGNIDLFDVEQ